MGSSMNILQFNDRNPSHNNGSSKHKSNKERSSSLQPISNETKDGSSTVGQ
jgi:hypothetical protein